MVYEWNTELFYFPGRQKRIRVKETGVILDLAGWGSSLVIVVQLPCNSCRVDCIFAACTNQDIYKLD